MHMIRVLYVDDEPDLLEVGRLFLERSKELSIDGAISVEEARIKMSSNQYDAVITDYQMAPVDGIEFLKGIRAEGNDIPVILFTGKGREEVVIEALNSGADFYLQKGGSPEVQFAELEHCIKQCVRKNQNEKARRESEEHFRSLVEYAFEGIGVHIDGKLVETNIALCDLTGYSKKELQGMNISELFTPDSWRLMSEKLRLPIADPYNVALRRKDGRIINVQTRGKTILWNGKNARLGAIWDYAHQYDKGLDRDVHSLFHEDGERSLLKAILESSPEVIVFALDNQYRYLAFNNRHKETMRTIWGKEIAVGDNMLDVIGMDLDRKKAKDNFDEALMGRSFTQVEEYGDGALKRLVWHDYYAPIVAEDGSISGLTCYCLNVTELERTTRLLQEVNSKLRIISSIHRHDVLNKLMALHAYLEMETESGDHPKPNNIAKMTKIVKDMETQINFTKEYQDIGLQKPEWQNVEDTITEVLDTVDLGRIYVVLDLPDLEILADPMLRKVFQNLIDNSVKHGGHVTKIDFALRRADEGIKIVYRDDGKGISEGSKKKLFTEGFGNNHGLGLFLAREILKITGIGITENGVPGKGARFEMYVPMGNFRFR